MAAIDPQLWSEAGWQSHLGWTPTPHQLHQLHQLYTLILDGNQRQNLTRIVDATDFWEKHLWDSLRGIQALSHPPDPITLPVGLPDLASQRILDLGTGAGFPGIPIAIACPQGSVTLVDATQRKIQFVQTVIKALGLTQVTTQADRIEVLARQPGIREAYDLVISRALAPAVACVEYSLPCLKVGGTALLYRGQWTAPEEAAVIQATQMLGGILTEVEAFQTPLTQSLRHCVILTKQRRTPQTFPRATGIPARQLLVDVQGGHELL